jgi:hypothetical protein
MANVLDNEVVLEESQGVVIWKNFVTGLEKLYVLHTSVNPNGTVLAPEGSIASGASGAWLNTDGATAWAQISTSSTGNFLAPNEYYVDTTQAAQPSLRIFPTVEEAVVAAEGEQSGPYLVRLRQAQAHTWDGTGLPLASTRDITIYGETELNSTLSISGVWNSAAVGASITFQSVSVTMTGDTTFGADRKVIFDGVLLNGGNFTATIEGEGLSCEDSTISAIAFFGGGATGMSVASFERCSITWDTAVPGSAFLGVVANLVMTSCDVNVRRNVKSEFADRVTLASMSGRISNSSFAIEKSGVGTFTFLFVGAGTVEVQGVQMTWELSGGVNDFGAGATGASMVGLESFGLDPLNLPSGAWHEVAGDIVVVP